MTKYEWLYCNSDWNDLINIIKLIKNCDDCLSEFYDMLKRDDITIKDVINTWTVLVENDIENAANEWFHEDVFNYRETNDIIYWFFNIYTGEARHIKYTVKVDCSGIIID